LASSAVPASGKALRDGAKYIFTYRVYGISYLPYFELLVISNLMWIRGSFHTIDPREPGSAPEEVVQPIARLRRAPRDHFDAAIREV